ncbi:CrcB family protein [Pelagibacterium sp. H642]|uniref:fluoride efflux transporter FluC n=1 Tax=Pelagibacterium sp. H642 TaxID=1881069 RepID=UPI0028166D81|nr:CrcB family protein [Pelagibacterium sp. H642]WMT91603.1 CrcB family protein [Pelagibacterium sp. H642]
MNGGRLAGFIAVGGAMGALLRFVVSMAALALWPDWSVAGTLIVNIFGSFAIGLGATWAVRRSLSQTLEASLIVGFCGGFTTFSAFSLETVMLIVGGNWAGAGVYVLASVVLWLAAAWAGWTAGEWVFAGKPGHDHTKS